MQSFRNILQEKLAHVAPKPAAMDEKTIAFLFEKIIDAEYGIQGKSNVLPVSFKEGILTLAVYKSLWQAEVSLVKESLRENMNQQIGTDLVKDIRIQRK